MTNQSEQSAKNAHYPEPGYTHPDEMPIVEQRPNPHSDLRGTIVHFTSEMLDNPNDYGIYPTTNFYNDLEEAILDWHNKQVEERLVHISEYAENVASVNENGEFIMKAIPLSLIAVEINKLKESK